MANIGDKKITHIYQGNELLTSDTQNTQSINIGNKPMSFVYKGQELLYPNPTKDSLLLYYDFKGLSNSSIDKEVAKDLSMVDNNGVLQNFSYANKSGYNNGLHFDGIDDYISLDTGLGKNFTISLTTSVENTPNNYILSSSTAYFFIRKNSYHLDLSILNNGSKQELFRANNFFIEFPSNKLNITYVVNSDDKKIYMYINGSLYTSFEMSEEAKPEMKITGIGVWNGSYFFTGSLYSLRVYDKPLSENEIKHNYNIEKKRWNL